MSRFLSHMLVAALASIVAVPGSAQHITSNVVGVDDTKYFAHLCLATAPSFAAADASQLVRGGPTFVPRRSELNHQGILKLVETDTACSCTVAFLLAESFLPGALNNFVVTLQREYRSELRSSSTGPIQMVFDFDGVDVEIVMKKAQVKEGLIVIIPQATRNGSCPA
ncbi:hypothetical protein [Yoonia sp. SS1-5]|uniref:DUF2195 family protein n=1 Tax=Yoonia rhodophyticola TaxID=3137370 RepID=A0AAN0NH79_9RHOB